MIVRIALKISIWAAERSYHSLVKPRSRRRASWPIVVLDFRRSLSSILYSTSY